MLIRIAVCDKYHGQHAEYIGLYNPGKEIKVTMEKGRQSDLSKPGHQGIPQSHHDGAGHDIAKKTQGHGYRRGKLADHIDRKKDGQRFKQVLHKADPVGFDPSHFY